MSKHPEKERISNLDDLENTLMSFLEDMLCDYTDDETYDYIINKTNFVFWQLKMNNFELSKK